jgi:O-antigen/teichoic acid export membrane protein
MKPVPVEAPRFDLVRRTLVVAGGGSAVSLVEFASVMFLVYWLKPAVWNEVAVVLMVYGTCRGLGQLSLQEGIYYFYGRVEIARRRGLIAHTAGMLAASAVIMATVILTLPHWLPAVTPSIASIIPILAVAVLFDLPAACTPQTLIAAERPTWSSVFNVSTSLLYFVCVGGPLVAGWGLRVFAFGLLASAILRFSMFLVFAHLALPRGSLRTDWGVLWKQFVYTAPLALTMASSVLNKNVDKWIVSALVPDQVGAYAFAATEVPFLTTVGYAMAAILSTRMVFAFQQGRPQLALEYWNSATTRGVLFIGPAAVCVILLAPEAIKLFFDPAYSTALLPFQIYNLLLFYRIMGYGMLLRSAGRTKTLWALSVSLLSLNAGLGFILTSTLGIVGTALGTWLANVIVFVATLIVMAQVMETSVSKVMPWRRYGAVLAVAVFAALCAMAAGKFIPAAGPRLAVKALVFFVCYFAGAAVFPIHRRLPPVPEDSDEFLRTLGWSPAPAPNTD